MKWVVNIVAMSKVVASEVLLSVSLRRIAWWFFAVALSTATSIIYLDRPLILYFESPEFKLNYWQFFRTVTDLGLGENYFALALFVFLLSQFVLPRFSKAHSQIANLKKWSLNLFICLLTSGFVLQLAKHLIGRQRPLETRDFNPLVFQPLNLSHYFHSLPSGHSQVMFCAATLLSLLFPRMRIFFFSVAIFIAFSRVATQQHWLSDTLLGAYLGWAISLLTIRWLTRFPSLGLR